MPTSEGGEFHDPALGRAAPRRSPPDGLASAVLTLVVAGCFTGLAFGGRIAVRDGAGGWRVLRVAEVWRAMLDHLPPEAPAVLGRVPLLLALAIGGLALAYALVATVRLPR